MNLSELIDKAEQSGYIWDDRFLIFYHKDATGPVWEAGTSVEQMEDILKEAQIE